MNVTLDDLSDPAPDPSPADWNSDGVALFPRLIPHDLIDRYQAEWWEANGPQALPEAMTAQHYSDLRSPEYLVAERPGGWPDCTPYMRHTALLELCTYPVLATLLEDLVGEPMGVHLNLTGWVTTERNWHQDTYLNPEYVGDAYAAVWIALGDIDPASGPFEYVPGSHRWHRLTRDKIGKVVDLDDLQWPKHTEDVLTPLVEREIQVRGAGVRRHLPRKGDVLIWHSRLYHRGTKALVRHAYRPALIAHYSGIHHRPDMPAAERGRQGGWLFPIRESGPVA